MAAKKKGGSRASLIGIRRGEGWSKGNNCREIPWSEDGAEGERGGDSAESDAKWKFHRDPQEKQK